MSAGRLAGIIGLTIGFIILSAYHMHAQEIIRYVALGDSYTIGTGADSPQEAWPRLLTDRLKAKGFSIELVGNLGRNGWTAQDVIDIELGELMQLNANFVTLLIGTNDWVQGIPADIFHDHLNNILDQLKPLSNTKHLVVLTIPDFSITPRGKEYADGRDISQGLKEFNAIINDECRQRGIVTVDLFSLSKEFANDPSLISSDGLHPSAKGYARWEAFMEPQIYHYLTK